MSRASEQPHVLLVDTPPTVRRRLGRSAMVILLGIGGIGVVGVVRPTADSYTPLTPSVHPPTAAPERWQPAPLAADPLVLESRDTVATLPLERAAPETVIVRVPEPATPVRRRPAASRERAPAPAPSLPPPHQTQDVTAASLAPGRLFISSRPWAQVYVDDVLVGHTPLNDVPISTGRHWLRVVREGFHPYERAVTVAPEQAIRLIDIELKEAGS